MARPTVYRCDYYGTRRSLLLLNKTHAETKGDRENIIRGNIPLCPAELSGITVVT